MKRKNCHSEAITNLERAIRRAGRRFAKTVLETTELASRLETPPTQTRCVNCGHPLPGFREAEQLTPPE